MMAVLGARGGASSLHMRRTVAVYRDLSESDEPTSGPRPESPGDGIRIANLGKDPRREPADSRARIAACSGTERGQR